MQRKQAARWQRERRRQRRVLVGAVVILLLIAVIPVVGYYLTFVAPPRRTIISVNGVEYTLGDMVKRARAQVALQVAMGQQPELATIPNEVLFSLMDQELLRQGAPREGVVVTRDDVDQQVRSSFYPQPPEGEVTDPDALEREFQENYRDFLNTSQLSDADYREIARNNFLRGAIREVLSDQVPSVEESVYVHWIRVSDDAVAEEVVKMLDEGEEFDRVARIYNQDTYYSNDNGEVGWVPRGAFVDLEETLFSIEHETVSGPIWSRVGTHILKVTDGPELQEIGEKMREVLKTRALEQWLDDERRSSDVAVNFGSSEYDWVIDKIRELVPISRALEG